MIRLLPILLFLLFSHELRADTPPPSEWVAKLSSSRFVEREKAEKQLLQIGIAAVPAIRGVLETADADLKQRCEKLIAEIERQDLSRKADAYQRGEAQLEPLPLQREFEKAVGTSPTARKLFAQAIRTNEPFLQKIAKDPKEALPTFQARCKTVYESIAGGEEPIKADLADLTALALASLVIGDPAVPFTNWKEPTSFAIFLANPTLHAEFKQGEFREVFGTLLLKWIETRSINDAMAQQFFLHFLRFTEYEGGVKHLRKLIADPKANPLNLRCGAMDLLGRIGEKASYQDLEVYFKFQEELTRFNGQSAQVCDQALGAAIRRSGKKPEEFRISTISVSMKGPDRKVWPVTLYSFPDDEVRKQAFAKWKEREKGK